MKRRLTATAVAASLAVTSAAPAPQAQAFDPNQLARDAQMSAEAAGAYIFAPVDPNNPAYAMIGPSSAWITRGITLLIPAFLLAGAIALIVQLAKGEVTSSELSSDLTEGLKEELQK